MIKRISFAGQHKDYETNIREKENDTELDLINRAVAKIWGKSASWNPDNGLGIEYGQVIRPMSSYGYKNDNSYNCVTGRLGVDVTNLKDDK